MSRNKQFRKGVTLAEDCEGALVCLFNSKWELTMLSRENPGTEFSMTGQKAGG